MFVTMITYQKCVIDHHEKIDTQRIGLYFHAPPKYTEQIHTCVFYTGGGGG